MSRLPRRFGRNMMTSYLNTATVAVITVVTTPILVNGLGSEGFGIWSLVASFALYLKLLDLGFGRAAAKYVARYEALTAERLAAIRGEMEGWLRAQGVRV